MVDDEPAMAMALDEARRALDHDDVPVGAVLLVDGAVVAARHNERELGADPLAHAELLVIRDGARAGADLSRASLVVTLEPCVMCAGAIRVARIATVVFGASDPRAGAAGSRYDLLGDDRLGAGPVVRRSVAAAECAGLLSTFFAERRGVSRR